MSARTKKIKDRRGASSVFIQCVRRAGNSDPGGTLATPRCFIVRIAVRSPSLSAEFMSRACR